MTTKEIRVEEHGEYRYELEPVHYKSKCVGLAATKTAPDDHVSPDDHMDWLLNEYGVEAVVNCFSRQLKQDVKNAVRGKYNKDKVSATTMINAIGAGLITPEQQQQAVLEMNAGKYKTFTDACAAYLGIGEDALKNADPEHIHWDCAK